jgi:hypothetical protein
MKLLDFSLIFLILPAYYDLRVYSASNRNEFLVSAWGGGGVKARPARETDSLAAIYEPIV